MRRTRLALSAAVPLTALLVLLQTPTVALGQGVTAAPSLPAGSVSPASASGCSQAVCIFITGSGLTVTNWTTSARLSTSMCTSATYLVNGSAQTTSPFICGNAGALLYATWTDPGAFANHAILCNTWGGVSGQPCETVTN